MAKYLAYSPLFVYIQHEYLCHLCYLVFITLHRCLFMQGLSLRQQDHQTLNTSFQTNDMLLHSKWHTSCTKLKTEMI